MTMGFQGMDIAAVRGLASLLDNSASQIQELMQRLTNELQNTSWMGPDREQFCGNWQGQHCSQLNSVISGLQDAANVARNNANEQESTSGR